MKRLLPLAALLAAAVLLLELALQLGHAVVVLSQPAVAPAETPGATVLCVGDSYTFGVGAGTPEGTYPAQLRELLADRLGPETRVLNAGWPAQDSYDVASNFRSQLEASTPQFVSILVGTNDRWRRPERFRPESPIAPESDRGARRWTLELRTAKLIRILLWGRQTTGSARPGDSGSPGLETETDAPNAEGLAARARRLLQQGKHAEVVELAGSSRDARPEELRELRRAELVALLRLGRRSEALRISDEFEELYDRNPSEENAGYLLAALTNTGQSERSLELANRLIESRREIVLAWQVVGWRARDRGDSDQAAAAFEAVLRLAPAENRSLRAETMRSLAEALEDSEPERATGLRVNAMFLDGAVGRTVGSLRAALGEEAAGKVESLLGGLRLDARERLLADDLLRGLGEAPSWEALEANLAWLVEETLAAGATPLVLSYPFCPEDIGAVQSRVALAEGARWIDVCSRFGRELESSSWYELFVADGHCTEAGYALVAEAVAATILESR